VKGGLAIINTVCPYPMTRTTFHKKELNANRLQAGIFSRNKEDGEGKWSAQWRKRFVSSWVIRESSQEYLVK